MDKIVVEAVKLARERTKEDMVTSLQWLVHDPDLQAGDLILQTNCVVRRLLLDSEVDMARKATDLVPPTVLEIAAKARKLYKEVIILTPIDFTQLLPNQI